MQNVMDTLRARGFIKQTVYEDELYEKLGSESVPFYIGFDPTADSLHVGHFMQLIAMKHMQDAGHKPIILIGGGTAMIGDPSGRTDMRSMMTRETIAYHVECFKKQMSRFISFEGENGAIIVNNADWLLNLNYIDFLRDIGVHFSVNKMLTAECFKSRMERGLSFLEFNYMLMQAYDFLVLFKKYGCALELGGDDQWSNIIGGVELVRKVDQKEVYGMTFALLLTSDGRKMGKTEKGAVWLDPEKTSPYDFFQYWRNVDDADVIKCMKMLTFLPLEEIAEYEKLQGSALNAVKEKLAYEVTKLIHGQQEADKALTAAKALFGAGRQDANMPTAQITHNDLTDGVITVIDLLVKTGLVPSKGEARRLIQQGGVSVNDRKIVDIAETVDTSALEADGVIIKKGKKQFLKVKLQ